MFYIITPYFLTSGFAALIAITVAVMAVPRYRHVGGRSLIALMLAAAIWSAGTAMEYAAVGIPAKIFWAKIEYLGVLSTPVFFLTLALEYNRLERLLKPRNLVILFTIPAITQALVFTNEQHLWIWTSFTPEPSGQNLMIFGHGFWFWGGAIGYSYLLISAGTTLLMRAAVTYSNLYRSQIYALIIAALVPLAGNLAYIALLSKISGYDPTSLLITISGVMIAWGIFRLRLLDLSPIARDTVTEQMSDAMFLLDAQDRLVDINLAGRVLIHPDSNPLGQSAAAILPGWEAVWNIGRDPSHAQAEAELLIHGETRFFNVRGSPFNDSAGKAIGRVIVLSDVTTLKNARDFLLRTAILEERDQMARELHDNLGQVLGFINLQAQAVHKYLEDIDIREANAHLERLISVTTSTQTLLRDTIHELQSPGVFERRFFPTLAARVQNFERDHNIHVTLDIAPAVTRRGFDPAVSAQLNSMIQEALNNIAKHACASSVQITFSDQGTDDTTILIADDGCGFDLLQPINEEEHLGLRFMRERAEQIGASLEVDSAPGKGVRLIIHTPLRPQKSGTEK